MSYGWRAWSMFGAGALFGVLAGAALYAPPELGTAPPPWEHWALKQTSVATAPAPAPQPVAAAAAPAVVVQQPAVEPPPPAVVSVALDSAAQPIAPAPPPVKVARKRKAPTELPAIDTSMAGAGPALELPRVDPEPFRAPAEYAPLRIESTDPSR